MTKKPGEVILKKNGPIFIKFKGIIYQRRLEIKNKKNWVGNIKKMDRPIFIKT
jgi:hypothetical protein